MFNEKSYGFLISKNYVKIFLVRCLAYFFLVRTKNSYVCKIHILKYESEKWWSKILLLSTLLTQYYKIMFILIIYKPFFLIRSKNTYVSKIYIHISSLTKLCDQISRDVSRSIPLVYGRKGKYPTGIRTIREIFHYCTTGLLEQFHWITEIWSHWNTGIWFHWNTGI